VGILSNTPWRGQKKKEKKEDRDTSSRTCLSGVEVGF